MDVVPADNSGDLAMADGTCNLQETEKDKALRLEDQLKRETEEHVCCE